MKLKIETNHINLPETPYSIDITHVMKNEETDDSTQESLRKPSNKKVFIGGIGNSQVDVGMSNVSINIGGEKRFLPGSVANFTLQNQNIALLEQLIQTIRQLSQKPDTDAIFVIEILKNIYIEPICEILKRVCSEFESNITILVIVSTGNTSKTLERLTSIHENIKGLQRVDEIGIFIQQIYGTWCHPPPSVDEIITTCPPDHETLQSSPIGLGSTTSKIIVSGSKEVDTVFRLSLGDIAWVIRVNSSSEKPFLQILNSTVRAMLKIIGDTLTITKKVEEESSNQLLSELYTQYLKIGDFYEEHHVFLEQNGQLDKKMEELPLLIFVLNTILSQITSTVRKMVVKIHKPPHIVYQRLPKRPRFEEDFMPRSYTVPYNNIQQASVGNTRLYPGANTNALAGTEPYY